MQVTGLSFEQTLGQDGELVKLLRVKLELLVPLTPEIARELGGHLLGLELGKRMDVPRTRRG